MACGCVFARGRSYLATCFLFYFVFLKGRWVVSSLQEPDFLSLSSLHVLPARDEPRRSAFYRTCQAGSLPVPRGIVGSAVCICHQRQRGKTNQPRTRHKRTCNFFFCKGGGLFLFGFLLFSAIGFREAQAMLRRKTCERKPAITNTRGGRRRVGKPQWLLVLTPWA